MSTTKEYGSPFPDLELINSDLLTFLFTNPYNCHPDKPIYIDGGTGKSWNYREVLQRTKRMVTTLQKLGVKRGDMVTIFSPNTIDYPIYFFGILGVDATASMASFALTPEELKAQLHTAKTTHIIAHSSLFRTAEIAVNGTAVRVLIQSDGKRQGEPTVESLLDIAQPGVISSIAPENAENSVACLCFSSGTTGTAKGVMSSHKNLTSNMQQNIAVSEDQWNGTSTFVGFLPFSHIYGLSYFVLLSLYTGSSVVIIRNYSLEKLLSVVEKYKINVLHLVPPVILQLTKDEAVKKYDLRHLKRVFSAAAPLSAGLRDAFEQRFRSIGINVHAYQAWGLTETSPLATQVPFNRPDKSSTVGCIVPNMSLRLVDPDTLIDSKGPNPTGEIWCKGPNVTKGYYNNEAATKDAFAEGGWFRTGDIGVFDDEGHLRIVDRIKELIKYKGFQVIPSELEGKLVTHAFVDDAAVIGVFDESKASELPTALIVLSPEGKSKGRKEAIKEIYAWFHSQIANHKRLRGGVYVIDVIPKSPSGKILRRQLQAVRNSLPVGSKL